MPKLTRNYRQQVVDEYLQASGRSLFIPSEFLEWLRPKKTHSVWPVFFGKSDRDAATEHRLTLCRQFIQGIRIVVKVYPMPDRPYPVRPKIIEVPAYNSPVKSRVKGGGYVRTDPSEPEMQRELARQAATALKSWINRHGGVVDLFELKLAPVVTLANQLAALGRESGAGDDSFDEAAE